MKRPAIVHIDKAANWVLRLFEPSDGVTPVDADSLPTVSVRKNGAATADSVTVTKRTATTGIYDCSYNPADEAEGDAFTIEESAVIGGTTYENSWEFTVIAPERGTDNAALAAELLKVLDYAAYGLTVLVGAISNANSPAEQFTRTLDGVDYSVTFAGLDTDGNRSATTLSKA
jgi:hypothetical protein